MSIRIGINGFGRIARVVIRAIQDMPEIELRAINVRSEDLEYMEYMLKYDTMHGQFDGTIEAEDFKDAEGNVTDVRVLYGTETYAEQMLRYSHDYSEQQ